MDRFDDCKTGEEIVARAKEVIKEIVPYDYEWAKNMELADELGWLKGAVTPTVRQPVGKLPSGKVVMAMGDSLISMDPIGGQGANLGNKQVQHFVKAIMQHKGAYDESWMQSTFDAFWNDHGYPTYSFNNALLEPLTAAGKTMLISQYGSTGDAKNSKNQQIADAIIDNFRDPRALYKTFLDNAEAKEAIKKITGKSWNAMFYPSMFQMMKNQIRQNLGLRPKHPLSKNSYTHSI